MSDTRLIIDLLKNGEFDHGPTDIIVYSNIYDLFVHNRCSNELYDLLNNIWDNLEPNSFSSKRVIIMNSNIDTVDTESDYYEFTGRPVILSDFVNDDILGCLSCSISYINETAPSVTDKNYCYGAFIGVLSLDNKGLTLDANYGVDNLVYTPDKELEE